MKTATITYHAAHNYGAMLQAFALQQTLLSLSVENKIINLRTQVQRAHYPHPNAMVFSSVSRLAGWLLYGGPLSGLYKKYSLFESFLDNDLILTKEYTDLSQLSENEIGADLFISGSDQVWNTSQKDYNDAYFLPFVHTKRKISYAASMGLKPADNVSSGIHDRIRFYLRDFESISVRDESSRELASHLTGKEVLVHADPTLLLERNAWDRQTGVHPLVKGQYVFVYYPSTFEELDDLALEVGKLLGIKVVISNKTGNLKAFFHMKKCLACGPWEFINLIKNATVVVTSSYHATLFSLLFHRPFYVLDRQDARIDSLLSAVGLLNRKVSVQTLAERISSVFCLDFGSSDTHIEEMRHKGIEFLKRAVSNGTV